MIEIFHMILAITLVSECSVLGNGKKLHNHMERKIEVKGVFHSVFNKIPQKSVNILCSEETSYIF